ncbi:MAG TPA: hypothetical protein VH643_16775 [Gemmataceae bacterium]|jgi:hypothetical protein
MRRLVVNALALAVVLAGMGLGLGQPPGQPAKKPVRVEEEDVPKAKPAPVKSKLEEMLAEALKNNPDIRVAAANVTLAEAELNRTRLQVTQKVIALHAALASQQAEVAYRQSQYERIKKLEESKSVSSEIVQEAQQKLTLAKAKLAEVEAQLPALLGKVARSAETDRGAAELARWANSRLIDDRVLSELERRRAWLDLLGTYPPAAALVKVQGSQADKIRKALNSPISVNFTSAPLQQIVDDLASMSGLHIKLMTPDASRGSSVPPITMRVDKLSLRSVLQLLEDSLPDHRIVVREYGLLIAQTHRIPPGAMTIEDFLRESQPADAPRGRETKPRNPPAENVEGLVKRVEESSGLMTIGIGSDAGLAKGHTLELFRLDAETPSKSKYLGTVRILEVKAKEAVAQPVGRLASPPKAGDRVASRILGN